MTLENPIIGVGLDNYGDWYRRSRTLEATLRRGPEVTSNAAHNVYLDISSNGGFPLLFLYTGLIGLVLYSAWKVLKRERDFNPGFTGLVAGWVAFQAQSMISINQIGLAIWGWVMSGLIIGYEISTRKNSELSETIKKRVSARKARQLQPNNAYLVIGLLFGFLIGMPTFLSSAKHNSALKQNNPVVIENTAYIWPYDPLRMIQVSSTLDSNNFESEGLKVGLDAVAKFPDNFAVWANLNALSNASVEQKSGALRQMKRLDPFNPNLK